MSCIDLDVASAWFALRRSIARFEPRNVRPALLLHPVVTKREKKREPRDERRRRTCPCNALRENAKLKWRVSRRERETKLPRLRLPGRFSALAKPVDSKRRRRRKQRSPASSRSWHVSSDPRPRIFPRPVSMWSFYVRSGSRYVSCRFRRVSKFSLTRSTILNRSVISFAT